MSIESGRNSHLHELRARRDNWLHPWLDLYRQAFPLDERFSFSEMAATLQRIETGTDKANGLLAILDREPPPSAAKTGKRAQFNGLIWYERRTNANVAILWYFAIARHLRGRGAGGDALQSFLSVARKEGFRAVLLEAENPGYAEGCNYRKAIRNRKLAERRIEFYRRNGAVLFDDLPYVLMLPKRRPRRMHLMAIPLAEDVSLSEMENLLRQEFQTGILAARKNST